LSASNPLMRRARTSGRSLYLASLIAPLARSCQYWAAFQHSTAVALHLNRGFSIAD
jgi:hypothetical protein